MTAKSKTIMTANRHTHTLLELLLFTVLMTAVMWTQTMTRVAVPTTGMTHGNYWLPGDTNLTSATPL